MSKKAIGIIEDDDTTWHARGVVGDYDTMCGIDGDDPAIGHNGVVEAKRGQKISCVECKTIWRNTMAMKLRESDFA